MNRNYFINNTAGSGNKVHKGWVTLSCMDFLFGTGFNYLPMAKGQGSYIRKGDEKRVKSIPFCKYCGSTNDLLIDHIYPVSKGGNSEFKNLTRCCNKCNSSKSDKTITEFLKHIRDRRSNAKAELLYCEEIIQSIVNETYKIN